MKNTSYRSAENDIDFQLMNRVFLPEKGLTHKTFLSRPSVFALIAALATIGVFYILCFI